MMKKMSRYKPQILWVIRILGTSLFLWLILRSVDLGDLLQQVRKVSLMSYLLLFSLYLFNQFLSSCRWKILLRITGIVDPIKDLFIAMLYGQTINRILPSTIGGDSARIGYLLNRYPQKRPQAIAGTVLDRIFAFLALMALAFFSLPFEEGLSLRVKLILGSVLGLFLILVGVIYWGKLDRIMIWFLNLEWVPEIITQQGNKFWGFFLEYRNRKADLLKAFALSLSRQALMILNIYFAFQAVGVRVPLVKLFLVIPVITLVVILPISIGGLGVREAALVSMLELRGEGVLAYSMIRYSFIALLPVILLADSLLGKLFRKGG